MDSATLRRLGVELEQFLEDCFVGMGRSERRAALGDYVRGLLLDGDRKSMVPIASRLADEPGQVGAIRQRLQQAVTVASWDDGELYRRIAKKTLKGLPDVEALALDDTGFPKKGYFSVGVQRQYSGTMGRIDNCQIATSLHLCSDSGGACIGMQLYLPRKWCESQTRRVKAGVPDKIEFKEKWRTALDLLDRAKGWDLARMPRVVLGDAGYGDVTEFRKGLRERGYEYILGIAGNHKVWPPGVCPKPPKAKRRGELGRPKTKWTPPRGKSPTSILELAKSLPRSAFRRVTWGEGTKGKQFGRFAFLRIRTAHRHQSKPPGDVEWLICEWPKRAEHPTTFYLSNMSEKTTKRRLVYLAKLRWRIERDYQEMKSELGLDHFEGRGWTGFHHHVACVAAAHAFLTLNRALFPPEKRHVSSVPESSSVRLAQTDRALPNLPANSVGPLAAQAALVQVIK